MKPEISVLMSVYDCEQYVGDAIDSILQQTCRDFEFIIIDDGSNDRSLEIINSYAKKDNRIVVVANNINVGLAASLNKCVSLSCGTYLARMDADDISLPDRFINQLHFMKKNPEVGVLGTAVEYIDTDENIIGQRIYPIDPILIYWRLIYENTFCHPSIMIRRESLTNFSYNPNLRTAQDYELWCRMVAQTKLANIPEKLVYFRKHPGKITYKSAKEQRDNSLLISQQYVSSLLQTQIEIDEIRCLWNRYNNTPKQTQTAYRLMYKSCLAICKQSCWNDEERKTLERYVFRQILECTRCQRNSWRILDVGLKLLLLAPGDLLMAFRKKIGLGK